MHNMQSHKIYKICNKKVIASEDNLPVQMHKSYNKLHLLKLTLEFRF